MNSFDEVKQAIADGKRVFAGSSIYEIVLDGRGQYLLKCLLNGYCIGAEGNIDLSTVYTE